jgi:hypothetical protein
MQNHWKHSPLLANAHSVSPIHSLTHRSFSLVDLPTHTSAFGDSMFDNDIIHISYPWVMYSLPPLYLFLFFIISLSVCVSILINLSCLSVGEQAQFFLNAFWDEANDQAECIYSVAFELIKRADMRWRNITYVHMYEEGNDLDFDMGQSIAYIHTYRHRNTEN